MESQLKSNITSSKHWVRLIYMLLFAFFLYIASMVVIALVVVQFVFALLTGADNLKLRAFGDTLTTYIQQALLFLTFNSEHKPFPFADWPTVPQLSTAPEAVVGEAHNPHAASELAAASASSSERDGPSVVDPLARQAEARGRQAESLRTLDEHGPSVVDPLARQAEARGKRASFAETESGAAQEHQAEIDDGPSVVDPLARQAEARGRNAGLANKPVSPGESVTDRTPPLVDPEAEKKILS